MIEFNKNLLIDRINQRLQHTKPITMGHYKTINQNEQFIVTVASTKFEMIFKEDLICLTMILFEQLKKEIHKFHHCGSDCDMILLNADHRGKGVVTITMISNVK